MGKETTSVLERFKAARLYVITCLPVGQAGPVGSIEEYERIVRAACEGGADVIQFRDKQMPHKQQYEVATRLRVLCNQLGVLFIVNDLLEVALASGADGVHFGQKDMQTDVARTILHQNGVGNFLIGRSTHSVEQALKAEQDGVDYIGIGPVYATPTKPTYQPVGLELVRQVTSRVRTPHVAIGGLDAKNIDVVLAAGAERIAVVRAVCNALDITRAARELRSRLRDKVEAS